VIIIVDKTKQTTHPPDFGACLPSEAHFRSADHNGNANAVPPEVANALAADGHTAADYTGADVYVPHWVPRLPAC
jgi:hypothetical protein